MKKLKSYFTVVLCLISMAALLIFPNEAKNGAYSAMVLCFHGLLPALFPFCIISSLLLSSEKFLFLCEKIPVCRPFKLSAACTTPLVIGCLFGFPLGGRAAAELFHKGRISRDEGEFLLGLANNSGPALAMSVAASFWKSRYFGIYLYAAQIISAFLSGIILRSACKNSNKTENMAVNTEPLTKSISFTEAVSGAVSSCLTVCGFVCCFSVIISLIEALCKSTFAAGVLAGILEVSSGMNRAAVIGGKFGQFLCGFSFGFSGISVLCQVSSFARPLGLKMRRAIVQKLLEGIFCGLLSLIPSLPEVSTATSVFFSVSPLYTLPCGALIAMFFLKNITERHKIKKSLDLWQ